MILTKEERMTIAKMVKPIWVADRENERAKGTGMLDGIFEKTIKTYAFERKENGKVVSIDISSLNAMDEQRVVSEWGGLSSFASRATDLVSNYCNE